MSTTIVCLAYGMYIHVGIYTIQRKEDEIKYVQCKLMKLDPKELCFNCTNTYLHLEATYF